MPEIVVVGGGGHAKGIISLLKRFPSYRLLGYTDLRDQGDILGIHYLGNDSQLAVIQKKYRGCLAVIGVGGVTISKVRNGIKQKLELLGYKLPAIISPTAVIGEEVLIGNGTVVFDGVVVNTGTRIGECVILNTHCTIDHDCVIGDFSHIAPGATLCGGVRVGQNSILSSGSIVIQYKTIGESCLVGAGATVVDDCCEPGLYLGTPARRKQDAAELVSR